jgi:hypothetical protein
LGYAAIYEVYSTPEILWQHDELLGWSHEPDSEAEYVGPRPWPVEFRSKIAINSLGSRGPEPASLPAEGIRILILGDSMVAGFEVEYEGTFVVRLEKKLGPQFANPIQVINDGVRGCGSDQSYLSRERGRELKPDIVRHWMSENDRVEDITIHRMRRIFGKSGFINDGSGRFERIATPVPLYPWCSKYRVDRERGVVRIDGFSGRMLCRLQLVLFDRSALFSFVTMRVPWDQWGSLLRDLYYAGIPDPNLKQGEGEGQAGTNPPPITAGILQEMATPTGLQYLREFGFGLADSDVLLVDEIDSADPSVVRFKHDSHYTVSDHEIVAGELAEKLAPTAGVPRRSSYERRLSHERSDLWGEASRVAIQSPRQVLTEYRL